MKTEQEVREAIKEFETIKFVVKSDEPMFWCGKPVDEVMSLSTIAVIIGKALGVIATCDNCKHRDKDMPFCNAGYKYSKNGSCKGCEAEE